MSMDAASVQSGAAFDFCGHGGKTGLGCRLKVGQEIADHASEEAAAKDGGTNGAAGGLVGETHVAAARIFLDGHFGNDGDAHAGAHHVQEAGELTALENNLRIDAGAAAGGYRGVAKAVAIAQEQKRIGAEIVEGKRAAGGELVIGRERGEKPLGEQWRGFEFAAAHGQGENGEVENAGAKAI